MKEKYLRVTMPDGLRWDVPARIIAMNQAFAVTDLSAKFMAEVDVMMLDDRFIKEWAENNMNWSDVSEFAKKVFAIPVAYQEGWVNGPKEIVERDVD